MKKIKIIGGRYGYISPNGAFSVKTENSAPFEVNDKEADRLIKRGVAEIVGERGKRPENDDETSRTGSNPTDEENAAVGENEGVPDYDESTSANELRAIAKKAGISFKVGMKKEEMLEALDEHFGLTDDEIRDGDEDFPLSAEDPI